MVTIDGDEIVSGSTIDGDEISEITMDGDVVWTANAIPDSVIDKMKFWWEMPERTVSTVVDSIGNANGTAQGTTNTSGDWWEDYAEQGDGTSYIETTTWGDWWPNVDGNNYAIAWTQEIPHNGNDNAILGVRGSSVSARWYIRAENDGDIHLHNDPGGDSTDTIASNVYGDDERVRVVWNRITNNTSNWELWVNGQEVSLSTDGTVSGSFNEPDEPIYLLARNETGDDIDNTDGIIDNLYVTEPSSNGDLTQSEIVDDYNAQPWA